MDNENVSLLTFGYWDLGIIDEWELWASRPCPLFQGKEMRM